MEKTPETSGRVTGRTLSIKLHPVSRDIPIKWQNIISLFFLTLVIIYDNFLIKKEM